MAELPQPRNFTACLVSNRAMTSWRLWFLVWLVACAPAELPGAENSLADASTPAAEPVPPSGFTLGRFVVNAPRPKGLNKNECSVVEAVEHLLLGVEDVVHCGDLPKMSTVSMRRDAQRCVLEAHRAKRPFRLTWEYYSYDSHDSAGIAARDPDSVVYFSRSSVPVASWVMRATLRVWSYSELRANDECDFENGLLCFFTDGGRSMYAGCEKLETF
jgi:hypothetical protein